MKPKNELLLEGFLKYIKLYQYADTTIVRNREVITNFIKYLNCNNKHFFDMTETDIENWLSEEKSTNKVSSNVKIADNLKTFYDYLITKKHIKENPVKEIAKKLRRKDTIKVLRPILSKEDVAKIVRAATNPRDRAILITFYKTGMRRHELLQLNLDSISWNDRRIRIPKRKGGNAGDVYFDDECERALRLWISVRVYVRDDKDKGDALFTNILGKRLQRLQVSRIVKNAAINSGVGKNTNETSEAITPHVFRYAFTTHLAGNRCHPKVIQMLRGDADATMLDRYTQFTPEQVRGEYLRTIPKLGV